MFRNDVESFKNELQKEFKRTDVVPANLILGEEIQQRKDCIILDQKHFTKDRLEHYRMSNCKAMVTPLSSHTRLRHWQAFLHVLKYLSGLHKRGLYYPRKTNNVVKAFSNANCGNCQVSRRSTTGYLACFHCCLIFWETCKQQSVSISTAEAEYKSLCDLTSELMWFKQWCEEARLLTLKEPILIYEHKQACIKTANGDCNLTNKRLKNVDIQLHFIKEDFQCQTVCLCYIPSAHLLANFLTR
ncbi:hypothetical protein O181_007206 [Austropuccinia psidii MF-1]|uniref:Uncharacterized protein n=1 Tax=Austropuccinia psidii MF-1 TaxID=1389203 RepID=A0A9Q3BKE7_9BASI|nr:hypothetical protein [Austropuccinia psidii MF-1]